MDEGKVWPYLKKKEFQDEDIIAFPASSEYIEEQAEYGVVAYIECLGDVERELRAKGMDSTLPIIAKIRRLLSSLGALASSQITTSQLSPI